MSSAVPDLFEDWMFRQFDALVSSGINPFDESVDWEGLEAGLAQEWSCLEEQRSQFVPMTLVSREEAAERARAEFDRNHSQWGRRAAQPVKCSICRVSLKANQEAAPYCCYVCWPLLIASTPQRLHVDGYHETDLAAD